MIDLIIERLKEDIRFKDKIEHIEVLPRREVEYGKFNPDLSSKIKNYIEVIGVNLYSHQCEVIDSVMNGKNVIITTPTASGKTLSFNIPVFDILDRNSLARVLYLYPTKALSNDQYKVIKKMEDITGVNAKPAVYDGDTPSHRRPGIRENSRIIISNPYELHHILPWHYKWEKFLSNLEIVLIDEAHRYRGVLGSNISMLMKRLLRLCDYYGSKPGFIMSSATLANPIEFAEKLTGKKYSWIKKDGSPGGRKIFILYNPYFDDSGEYSTHQETKNLLMYFVKNGLQTLCFTVSRKMAETITSGIINDLEKNNPELRNKIAAYRAGYLPEERREIEDKLKRGKLMGITSTNALELGIDIGSLDCVIISGFPGTIISTWQQAGRAGRGINDSITVLVAFNNPLDQYFMKNPSVFFEKSNEHAIADDSNPYILSGHIMCAASELPLTENDREYFGEQLESFSISLEKNGLLKRTTKGWVYSGKVRATEFVSIDNISSEVFSIVCNGELLETLDRPQVYREAYPGAILLHQGEKYMVNEFDIENYTINVKKSKVDFYTQAIDIADITIIDEIQKQEKDDFCYILGNIDVSEDYIKYKIKRYDKVIGIRPLNLPPLKFKTTGLWITFPDYIAEKIWDIRKNDNEIMELIKERSESNMSINAFSGGLHGIEHSLISVIPFYVMCDRNDIGGLSTNYHPDTGKPTIFVYDGYEGGVGLCEKAFNIMEDIIIFTRELVLNCECDNGCPACIYSPKCGSDNEPLDKKATITILDLMSENI